MKRFVHCSIKLFKQLWLSLHATKTSQRYHCPVACFILIHVSRNTGASSVHQRTFKGQLDSRMSLSRCGEIRKDDNEPLFCGVTPQNGENVRQVDGQSKKNHHYLHIALLPTCDRKDRIVGQRNRYL